MPLCPTPTTHQASLSHGSLGPTFSTNSWGPTLLSRDGDGGPQEQEPLLPESSRANCISHPVDLRLLSPAMNAYSAARSATSSRWVITSESVPRRPSPTAQSAMSHLPASTDLSLSWGSSHQLTIRPPDGPAFLSKLPSL